MLYRIFVRRYRDPYYYLNQLLQDIIKIKERFFQLIPFRRTFFPIRT